MALPEAHGLLKEALAWIENSSEPAPSLCGDIRKFLAKPVEKPLRKRRRTLYTKRVRVSEIDGQLEVTYSHCGEFFPQTTEYFFRCNGGLNNACKACRMSAPAKKRAIAKAKREAAKVKRRAIAKAKRELAKAERRAAAKAKRESTKAERRVAPSQTKAKL